jgi:hypothetical protein
LTHELTPQSDHHGGQEANGETGDRNSVPVFFGLKRNEAKKPIVKSKRRYETIQATSLLERSHIMDSNSSLIDTRMKKSLAKLLVRRAVLAALFFLLGVGYCASSFAQILGQPT